jgi:hypothetical protein
MRLPVERRVVAVSELDRVFAGHPVGFDLLTVDGRQFVAYYDADRRLTVAQRSLDPDGPVGAEAGNEGPWQRTRLPERVGWDSHNDVHLAVDAAGHLHLAGNVHVDPLVYFRSTDPLDAATFERVGSLVGRDEDAVTYPQFLDGPDDTLVFMYRDGGSGDGRRLLDAYDPATGEWGRLLSAPLLDGRGEMNAYPTGPVRGPEGDYHLCWVWRDTPDCATNHDLSYARSPDLRRWEQSDGHRIDLPITADTGEVVDPVPSGGGMLNRTEIGFDRQGRPILTYHKFGDAGDTQAYNARREADGWTVVRASDWDYRWDFGGRGSIDIEIRIDPVRVVDGRLVQTFAQAEYGTGRWTLDPETLEPVETECPWHGLPRGVREAEREGLGVQWLPEGGDPTADYALRWETLPANRDRARDATPDPGTLRVYRFE